MSSEEELAARLDEDEAAAWAVHDVSRCDALLYEEDMPAAAARTPDCDCGYPARVLRFVAAGRELLAGMEQDGHGPEFYGGLGYAIDVLAKAYRGDGK